jgi:DNA-binding CsgD family transcriptional regulator
LNVSLGTARNQLKSIFVKTETNRQAELVALLWRVSDLAVSTSLVPV